MKDKLIAWLVTRILKLLSLLSYSSTQKLGRVIGRALWLGDSSLTRVTKVNVELAFPDLEQEQQQALIKASLTETAKLFAEFGAMWEWPTEKALGLVKSVRGKELFDMASEQNKGLIVLAPHHGNWELVGLYLSTLRPMAALYRPPK
ncbi:lysophospholipid acyltransferase family protein, partial [Oleiphilus sp. HI0066]|uniref:lysophospholipid acyltransferase family protein n=2 Tax=Oleiphilus TaxID=141450 RepID=UPI000A4DEACF